MSSLDVGLRLDGVERSDYPALLHGLAAHLGLTSMLKAHVHDDGEGDDPRLPELFQLIRLARKDWARWGDKLIAQVTDLHGRGQLFPLTEARERVLMALLEDHSLAMLIRFARPAGAEHQRRRLETAGLISPELSDTSWIEVSYRIGRQLETLASPPERPKSTKTLARLVKDGVAGPWTPKDEAAVRYLRRRAAIYMRRPAHEWTGEAWRVVAEADRALSGDELAAMRSTIEAGYRGRLSVAALGRELKEAAKGTALVNNMTRVARTELVNAHAQGAWVRLKEQAIQLGLGKDPRVYKLVARTACKHCKRIWGPNTDPHLYRVSTLEARERAGANFRLPAAQWGPVIGPVHPNCTEGAAILYIERIKRGARSLAERVKADGGRLR